MDNHDDDLVESWLGNADAGNGKIIIESWLDSKEAINLITNLSSPKEDTLKIEATRDNEGNITGTSICHKTDVAEGTYGGVINNSIIIPKITIDKNGHVTAIEEIKISLMTL
jgi:hypothetical protein